MNNFKRGIALVSRLVSRLTSPQILFFTFFLAAAITTFFFYPPFSKATNKTYASHQTRLLIESCYDGDTCHARHADGFLLKLRLFGIDTPEMDSASDEKLAIAARDYLRKKIVGHWIEVQILGMGYYNRHLSWLVDNKEEINIDLVKKGFARRRGGGKWSQKLKDAQLQAQKKQLGIWARRKNGNAPRGRTK